MSLAKSLRPLLAALAALVAACAGAPTASDTVALPPVSLPDSVAVAYRRDAVALAAQEIDRAGAPAAQSVELSATLVESLYRALGAVYGATAIPARDTVVNVYGIHVFGASRAQQLAVDLDVSATWAHAWAAKLTTTGNQAVDTLVARYGLVPVSYFSWSTGQAAFLETTRPLNLRALGTRFAAVPGVRGAEPAAVGGDGDDIEARPAGTGWVLDYSVGYGDCPAGCISRRYWTFQVDATGGVTYLGSRGAPPPAPSYR